MTTSKGAPLLLLPFLVVLVTCYEEDYCSFCDTKGTHTMCKYPNESAVAPCVNDAISEEDDPGAGDRTTYLGILTYANVLRNDIAQGKSQFKLPKAANMHVLLWHIESAAIAQRWADQCQFSHDECRVAMEDISVIVPFAQNIGQFEAPSSTPTTEIIHKIMEAWIKEGESFQESQIDSHKHTTNTENFTNLIWGSAHLIGCGRIVLPSATEGKKIIRLVCNIGPGIGVENSSVYEKGEPQTKCRYKKFVHAPKFEGLCTTVHHKEAFLSSGNQDSIFNKHVYIYVLVVLNFHIVLYIFPPFILM